MGVSWDLNKLPKPASVDSGVTPQPAQSVAAPQQTKTPSGNIITSNLDSLGKIISKGLSATANTGNFTNSLGVLGQQTGLWGGGLAQGTSTYSAASGIGAGQVGGVGSTTHLGGVGAGSIGPMIAMAPMAALGAVVVPKLTQGLFGDKPKIKFSGLAPKYGYQDGASNKLNRYSGPEHDKQTSKKKNISSENGYHYNIEVDETGKDAETKKALVQKFDAAFDQLSAQGVPVNDLLDRNKDFFFGGRVDKGMNPEQLAKDVFTHMAPDIEAYKAGQVPTEREITVRPMGARSDGMASRDAYDQGLTRQAYSVTVGQSGAAPTRKEISIKPNDPRAGLMQPLKGRDSFDRDNATQASLTPGFTYNIDTSGMSGRDAYDQGLTKGNTSYTVPEIKPQQPPAPQPVETQPQETEQPVKAPGLKKMNWKSKDPGLLRPQGEISSIDRAVSAVPAGAVTPSTISAGLSAMSNNQESGILARRNRYV